MNRDIAALAQQYRGENGHTDGVVVIWYGTVCGWMNELRDPQNWTAGCIAIDADGNQWQATGGNDYDGATRWIPINQETRS